MESIDENFPEDLRRQLEESQDQVGYIPAEELLEIAIYPELEPEKLEEEGGTETEVAELVAAARQKARVSLAGRQPGDPIAYVSNARNAVSTSDSFTMWGPCEETSYGIGSLVCHTSPDPHGKHPIQTFGIITKAEAHTLGLDDFASHAYEADSRPPLGNIQPTNSQRRPVVSYVAKVLNSTQAVQRPVLSGPVYEVKADQLNSVHGKPKADWPGADYMLLGFYQDGDGNYGVLAEERSRVLGPKQGHVILSGVPGGGKTSLYLTLNVALFTQLQRIEQNPPSPGYSVPKVVSLAFNVKGADLLFLDHLDQTNLTDEDRLMWAAANVDITQRPFKRVIVFTPLAADGLNRNSLRNNPNSDQPGYSHTYDFALGIKDLWPYLHLFFDKLTSPASSLLAEIESHFEDNNENFSLADVIALFDNTLNQPQNARAHGPWGSFTSSTIRSVYQRFKVLPSILGGLIDITGNGFGLDQLNNLQPFDTVVIDLERIMANPRDPATSENAIKIITAYILNRLTEAMTSGSPQVTNVIVFADELNRLAPRNGDSGIGAQLSQLARTTRDRGIVLFGAGQFRSGINEDILKAASVSFSMQTPEYELNDRMYQALSPEFKAKLTQLKPGQSLAQYPALRSAVFAMFPRPFMFSGAEKWRQVFPQRPPRPVHECVAERIRRIDPNRAPQPDEVQQLVEQALQATVNQNGVRKPETEVARILRDVEIRWATANNHPQITPWAEYSRILRERFQLVSRTQASNNYQPTPSNFFDEDED